MYPKCETVNFTMLAQNTDVDYVQQACLAAMSIKYTNKNSSICLVTNDSVPDRYKSLFDHIVEIPWGDSAKDYEWKIHNRWKIYHATPYEQTIVLDTDMLVLEDISKWWNFLQTKELFFTTNVRTYKNDIITSRYYRQAFDKFHLPNLYSGLHYFKKCEKSHYFYKWLELYLNNWEKFQGEFAGGKFYQKTASVDLAASLISKILGNYNDITCSVRDYPYFVHMKLHCQNWEQTHTTDWQKIVGVYLNEDLELKIGNYRQQGVFHYTEDTFVTDRIIGLYERKLGIQ